MFVVHAGALLFPLGPRDTLSTLAVGPLPHVTAAFCSIEGGKQYASSNKQDARDVHLELLAVMYGVLRSVPGGYFVRHQDGELKYLVVFAHPEVGTFNAGVNEGQCSSKGQSAWDFIAHCSAWYSLDPRAHA